MKNTPLVLYLFSFLMGITLAGCQAYQIPWNGLVTENGLDDLIEMGGAAIFKIEDGIITGTTVANTENNFLFTSLL
jgi:hypothetical protein